MAQKRHCDWIHEQSGKWHLKSPEARQPLPKAMQTVTGWCYVRMRCPIKDYFYELPKESSWCYRSRRLSAGALEARSLM